PRDIPDRLWLLLLSLESERRHVVLGPAADDARLHGDPRRRDRGAREPAGGSDSALAAAGDRRVQPAALALDPRSSALPLGAVLCLPDIAAAVPAAAAEIYRAVLLFHPRGILRARQVAGALRPRGLFGRIDPERAHAQASRRRHRLLRDPAILRDAPVDRLRRLRRR